MLMIYLFLFNLAIYANNENDTNIKINKAIEYLNSNKMIKIEDAFSFISNIKNIRNSNLFDALKNAKTTIENSPDSYGYKYIDFDNWLGQAATYEKILELINMGLYEKTVKISDKKTLKKLYSKLKSNISNADKLSIKKTICKILSHLNIAKYKIKVNSKLYIKIEKSVLKYKNTADTSFEKKIIYDTIIIKPLYIYKNIASAKINYYKILDNGHKWHAGNCEVFLHKNQNKWEGFSFGGLAIQ